VTDDGKGMSDPSKFLGFRFFLFYTYCNIP
jgi:hypothetical protein